MTVWDQREELVATESEERLRLRAFQIWQSKGSPEGCDVECWLEAEREMQPEGSEPAAAKDAGSGDNIKGPATVGRRTKQPAKSG